MTARSTISIISCGTPGTAYTTFSTPSTGRPDRSVPAPCRGVCGMTVAPSGTIAWRRLFSAMRASAGLEHLGDERRDLVVEVHLDAAHHRGDRVAGQVVVGRAEPATDRCTASASASEVAENGARFGQRCRRPSPGGSESMPLAASCSPIHDELVSTICPSSSSVPTADDITAHQTASGRLRARRRGSQEVLDAADSASTTATQRSPFHSHVASRAVSGSEGEPDRELLAQRLVLGDLARRHRRRPSSRARCGTC